MDYSNLMLTAVFVLAIGTIFFSVNAISLRLFSLTKLQDAFYAKYGEGNNRKLFEKLVANSEKLYLACSLYRLIFNASILAAVLGVFAMRSKELMQTGDYISVFLISAGIISVFSLAAPHAWAKYAGEKILIRTYKLLFFFSWLAGPVLYLFKLHDKIIGRLTGSAHASPQEQQEAKEEEFLSELEEHKMLGAVDAEEQQMIENVLHLSERYAGEIMTPRTDIAAVDVNADLQSILRTITTGGHSRFPVYDGNIDNIVGFLYAKDLLNEIGKPASEFRLKEKLRPAYFVPETKPLRALLRKFQSKKLHIAILLDEYGGTAGIVTLEDILEELVGEITDEYEQTEPVPIKRIDKDTVEVDAQTSINDLNQQLELNLPESEDYDTVGGFICSYLGYIPKTGKSFEHERLRFAVISAEPRKIKKITITKITPAETQS